MVVRDNPIIIVPVWLLIMMILVVHNDGMVPPHDVIGLLLMMYV